MVFYACSPHVFASWLHKFQLIVTFDLITLHSTLGKQSSFLILRISGHRVICEVTFEDAGVEGGRDRMSEKEGK